MLKIKEKDIAVLAECIGLPFLPSLRGEGKVCFATNTEVRPDFLESFNERHILAYISGYLTDTEFETTKHLQIPFPDNADYFWKCVEKQNYENASYLEKSEHDVVFFRK